MKNFPYFVLMRVIWRHAEGRRLYYATSLFLLFLSPTIWLLGPYIMGLFFNTVQEGLATDEQVQKAIILILLHFSLQPLTWMLHGPGRIMERQSGFYVRQNFVRSTYNKLRQLPYAWHQNFHTGQLYDRLRKAEDALEEVTSHQFRYFSFIINFFGPIIALIILFKWFGIICLALTFAASFLLLKFDKRLVPLYEKNNKLSHEYAGVFSDYMANIRTIIALRLGDVTEKELLQRYELRKPTQWEEYRVNEWKWFTIEQIAEAIITVLIIAAVWMARGQLDFKIGNLLMLIQYLQRFSNVFYNMGYLYQDLVKAATNYRSVEMIEEAYDKYVVNRGVFLDKVDNWQHIEIRDLSFAYEDSEHRPHAIQNIVLDMKHGEKIAFVGPSGAGKSTLMTLLRGLYQPDKGYAVIDGKTFSSIAPLADMTTLIPQDPEIFENTIRYNITFGVTHTDEEIMYACRIAGFDTVIKQLPKGLESDIREKGVNLSGGQKQRLALARGVFAIQQSSLILMDEPTSSVDTVTELRIFERLFKEFKEKTIIASVHRLHLLSRFDKIIVIEDGKIIQQGKLPDLIAQKGVFSDLWKEYQEQQAKDGDDGR